MELKPFGLYPCDKCGEELYVLDGEDFDLIRQRVEEQHGLSALGLKGPDGKVHRAARLSGAGLFACPACGHGNLLPPRSDPTQN